MRTTVDDKKQTWINHLVEARRSILELAQTLPAELEDQPFIGVWSIKDLFAHLIGWDQTNTDAITEALQGIYPTFLKNYDKDWKSYNEHLIAQYKKPSLAEMLKDAQDSHERFISFLNGLPAQALVKGKVASERGRTITIANLLRAEASDEHDHAEQVRAFLQQQVFSD